MVLAAAVLGGLLIGSWQPPPAADRPPRALTELRDAAIAVYGPALAGDWPKASESLTTVDAAARSLPRRVGKADLVRQLRARLQALHDDVRLRRANAAATNANWVARLADEMSASYETSVPADVRLLPFFGRQIEVDAARQRRPKLNADIADLRTVWRRVERSVLQRNGIDAARRFGDALAQVDAAARHGDLRKAAEAEVSASQQVLEVFRSGAAHS